MVGDNGKRVTGRYESASAVDHVAVAVTVGGGAEGNVLLVDDLDKGVGVGEVGVGMTAVEVWRGLAVLDGVIAKTEFPAEDSMAVGARDTGQSIEEDLEVGVLNEELFDQVKVEDVLQHVDVVVGAIDDLYLEAAICLGADGLDVDIWDIGQLVGGQGF